MSQEYIMYMYTLGGGKEETRKGERGRREKGGRESERRVTHTHH